MKTHFDPMLKKQVMHGHDLEDITGIGSIASGNLGALDASAGTLEVPIDPPESTKSGFWIITKAGYIDLDGVSTLFEAGDFLTYDLNSGEYARVDNKILDATLDISSTFTNSLNDPSLVNQKLVNERLDIYVSPAGAAAGSIPYWDGAKRVDSDPNKWKWDPATEKMMFGNTGQIVIGENIISRYGSSYLQTNNGLIVNGSLESGSSFKIRSDLQTRNKANDGWINIATRNVAGAEVVYDWAYVGNITAPYGIQLIAPDLYFKIGGNYSAYMTGSLFRPYLNNVMDLGSSAYTFKDLYIGGKIYIGSDCSLYRNTTDELRTDDNLNIGVTTLFTYGGNYQVRNKANSGWLNLVSRNITGTEVVGDLTYIGNITMPYASTILTTSGILKVGAEAADLYLRCGGYDRWRLQNASGHLLPLMANTYNIGGVGDEVKDGYFAGTVFTGVLNTSTQTPATAGATGVVGTITWDADFIYVCIAANTWKRAALSTW